MAETRPEPAFQFPSHAKRPWWVAIIVGGISTGIGIAAALGMNGAVSRPAQGSERGEPTMSLPPGSISLDSRLQGIEATLHALSQDMIEVKQRLPPKKP